MFWKKVNTKAFRMGFAAIMAAAVLVSAIGYSRPVQAHCDSEQGPVATAAHQALEKGDVKLVLPYVKADSEVELTAAFKQASEVRKAGGTAKTLADRYFVEAAIRLHRQGEGAAYNGLTDEETPEAILTADKAMASGSMKDIYKMMDAAIQKGVKAKYDAVVTARKEAARLNTVEAHRERVEAELMFEKYVYELFTVATAEQPHAEGAAVVQETGGHTH